MRRCECSIRCLRHDKERCSLETSNSNRIVYHWECRENWVQCEHMLLVSKQLEEYSEYMSKQTGLPTVPGGCIPLIGYPKKPSTMLSIKEEGRDFLAEREAAIAVHKRKYGVSRTTHRMKKKRCYNDVFLKDTNEPQHTKNILFEETFEENSLEPDASYLPTKTSEFLGKEKKRANQRIYLKS